MVLNSIFITANTDAVDAAPITKDLALIAVAKREHTSLDRVGAIGDSVNDLPFLALPELGFVGAPRNAQPQVKKFIERAPNGYLSGKDYLEGFLDFYDGCTNHHLKLVFADRDGVLLWTKSVREIQSLAKLFRIMGNNGFPLVFVITGSSSAQNQDLLGEPAIAQALAGNQRVRHSPQLILVENGAIALNVLDGSADFMFDAVNPETCFLLTGEFRAILLEKVKRDILPKFGLAISCEHADQNAKIFLPEKKTMVTLNIPRKLRDHADYRRSLESEVLRSAIVEAMISTAEHLGIPYRVLGEDVNKCIN